MAQLAEEAIAPPLALVAEDNDSIRKNAVRRLEKRGVEALEAASFEDAKATLDEARWPDVAIIDIHLDAHNKESADKGGLDIVRLLRRAGRPIQVVGYSGKFDEGSIDTSDLDLFDHIARKGRLGAREHTRLWETCAEFARSGFDARLVQTLNHLRREHESVLPDSELLRRWSTAGRHPGDDPAPGLLGKAGFRLQEIAASDPRFAWLARSIVLWIQHVREGSEEQVNVEVYGHPDLYASGTSEDEAIATLGHFALLVKRDLMRGGRTRREDALFDFLVAITAE